MGCSYLEQGCSKSQVKVVGDLVRSFPLGGPRRCFDLVVVAELWLRKHVGLRFMVATTIAEVASLQWCLR